MPVRKLDYETRLQLMRFACAFAWADLELHPTEKTAVLQLVERLALDRPEDRARVLLWLKSPPSVDELDPHEIPREARRIFLDECAAIIRADGIVHPEEVEAFTLLESVLFGDRRGEGPPLAQASGAPAPGSAKGAKKATTTNPLGETSMAKKTAAKPAAKGNSKQALIDHLNTILQMELSGVSRYLHYSFMVFGPNRIPIVSFFRAQATEGMTHAIAMGEKITSLGGHPTIRVDNPPESGKHDVRSLLQESLEFERSGVALYRQLLAMCGDDIALEELTRAQIRAETEHCEEVEKMLRTFGT